MYEDYRAISARAVHLLDAGWGRWVFMRGHLVESCSNGLGLSIAFMSVEGGDVAKLVRTPVFLSFIRPRL